MALILWALLPATATAGCRTAADCSLNGKCTPGGVCECLPQWYGAECGQLNLLPLRHTISGRKDVNATTRKNISSWGGSVQLGPGGVFHMWSAEMAGSCGIDTWLSNSIIAHSTAKDPAGQYERQSETWPVFAHEPVVAKAPTGEFVMFFTSTIWSGVGRDLYPYTAGQTPVNGGRTSYCASCPGDGSTGRSCHAGRNWSMPLPTFMSYTRTPEGNWSTPVAVPKVQQAPLIDSNLSPLIFKNGSLLGLWRNDDDRGSIHTCVASDWRDPETYVQYTYDIFSRGGLPALDSGLEGVEDPYLWQAKDGSFHMLVHGDCGYHAFSQDGLHWLTSPNGSKTCAFPRESVPHEDGGKVSFARRERPHLILGADGFTPIALSTSVTMDGGGDYSWTQIQQISDRPRQHQQQHQRRRRQQQVAEQNEVKGSAETRSPVESARRGGEPFSCDGGNVMQLSSGPDGGPCNSAANSPSSACTTADISRTGLEGLIGYQAPDAKRLSFTADNFAINLTVVGQRNNQQLSGRPEMLTRIALRSESDTDSRRFCGLMSACSNHTVARLIYRCQEIGGEWPTCSGYCHHMHFQVAVDYILGGSPARVRKVVNACELTGKREGHVPSRECDASKRVEVAGTELWGSIRPSCVGTAC